VQTREQRVVASASSHVIRGAQPKRPHLVLHRVYLVITAPPGRCHTPAPARTSTDDAGLLLRSLLLLLLLLSFALFPLPLLLLLALSLLPELLLSLLALALLPELLLTLPLLLLQARRSRTTHSRARPLIHIREAA